MNLVNVSLASHLKLSLCLSLGTDEEKEYMSYVPYAIAVGNLVYVMVSTGSDISHVVRFVSRVMANLGK